MRMRCSLVTHKARRVLRYFWGVKFLALDRVHCVLNINILEQLREAWIQKVHYDVWFIGSRLRFFRYRICYQVQIVWQSGMWCTWLKMRSHVSSKFIMQSPLGYTKIRKQRRWSGRTFNITDVNQRVAALKSYVHTVVDVIRWYVFERNKLNESRPTAWAKSSLAWYTSYILPVRTRSNVK